MFSQLGPLFKTQFRQTESSDTRQFIPHEERDLKQKKQNEKEKNESSNQAWTDDASVSVGALRLFLIEFLKTLPEGQDQEFISKHDYIDPNLSRPKENKRPTNTHNAKAVRAYQTMASYATPSEPIEPPDTSAHDDQPTADKLASKELRDIHNLIIDLEYLEKKGVHTLTILKADDFVESLKNAVLLEKSKI